MLQQSLFVNSLFIEVLFLTDRHLGFYARIRRTLCKGNLVFTVTQNVLEIRFDFGQYILGRAKPQPHYAFEADIPGPA
jgi:hypothetical protein